MNKNGWIAVDLDRTLAHYTGWCGTDYIGEPIAPMVERVKRWVADGQDVRVFTARVSPSAIAAHGSTLTATKRPIEEWCIKHIGCVLPITCEKDGETKEIWDDRAVQIIANTGKRADGKP